MSKYYTPLEAGNTYHIWTHANGSENLFRSDENYRYFLEKYIHYISPVAKTYAYNLMPNHLHFLIRTLEGSDTLQGLPTLPPPGKMASLHFSHLFNAYSQAYNKKYESNRSLFIPRFNRKKVDSDDYFTALIIYVHKNAVHHGMVKKIGEWAYSSWHDYLADYRSWICRQEVLDWFGGRDQFIKAHLESGANTKGMLFDE